MAARGRGAPPITRERPCRKCGGDAWRKESGSNRFRCIECAKQKSRAQVQRNPARFLWRMAKHRASKSGVRFNITPEDVQRVWPRDGRCPALGIPLSHGKGGMHDASPSLDRINSAWGYEPGNIAVLSFRANRAKGNMTARELMLVAQWMRRNGLT